VQLQARKAASLPRRCHGMRARAAFKPGSRGPRNARRRKLNTKTKATRNACGRWGMSGLAVAVEFARPGKTAAEPHLREGRAREACLSHAALLRIASFQGFQVLNNQLIRAITTRRPNMSAALALILSLRTGALSHLLALNRVMALPRSTLLRFSLSHSFVITPLFPHFAFPCKICIEHAFTAGKFFCR
jgi:hypothetical protein